MIISAKPIPGNELRVHDAINRLAKMGAEVLHEDNAPVHVSGHGKAEELRTIIGLVRPKAVMPVHGEFRMLAAHAQLAREGGVPDDRIVMAENGSVVELRDGVPRIVGEVEAGMTFVDGLGVGDVHDVALRDRRKLSEDGILIVVATLAAQDGGGLTAPPELIARGFGERAEPLLDELREEADRVLRELLADDVTEIKLLQEHLHDALGGVVYDRTRRPADGAAGHRRGLSAAPRRQRAGQVRLRSARRRGSSSVSIRPITPRPRQKIFRERGIPGDVVRVARAVDEHRHAVRAGAEGVRDARAGRTRDDVAGAERRLLDVALAWPELERRRAVEDDEDLLLRGVAVRDGAAVAGVELLPVQAGERRPSRASRSGERLVAARTARARPRRR